MILVGDPVNDLVSDSVNDSVSDCVLEVERLGFSLGHDWHTVWRPDLSHQGLPMLVCSRCGENGWALP